MKWRHSDFLRAGNRAIAARDQMFRPFISTVIARGTSQLSEM